MVESYALDIDRIEEVVGKLTDKQRKELDYFLDGFREQCREEFEAIPPSWVLR